MTSDRGHVQGWRDIGTPARWLRAVLVAFVVVAAVSVAALVGLRAQASGASPADDPDDLAAAQTAAQVVWGLQVVVMLALLVLVVTWTRRLAVNHVGLARPGTRFATPGWAVGAWFLWFALPPFVLRELWKGSDPTVPEGSPAWRGVPTTPVVWVWFVAFVGGTLVTNLTNDALAAATRADPDRLAALAGWRAGATLVLVVGALLLRWLTVALTARQRASIARA